MIKKYSNFLMKFVSLCLIVGAVTFYNYMLEQKDNQAKAFAEADEEGAVAAGVAVYDAVETPGEKIGSEADSATEQSAGTENAQEEQTQAKAQPEAQNQSPWKDGTYEGTAQGFGGDILVQVTVADGALADLQVLSAENEDAAYFDQAVQVIDRILEQQSTQVDTVSGATFSSGGIKDAVESALEGAANES